MSPKIVKSISKSLRLPLHCCLAALMAIMGVAACSSDSSDLVELAFDPPSRKPIDRSLVGVNNFFVNPEFGTIPQQFSEIRNTLGVKFVRVLFAWSDDVQSSPDTAPNYSFYDDIINAIPGDVDVVVVLSHTPNWMSNSANWIDGNPRKTWVERWLRPTVARYAGRRGIIGYEIWNEPDLTTVASDTALDLENADSYFELLQLGSQAMSQTDPSKLKVIAATTSVQSGFPETLNFNIRLRDLGAESLVDRWNIHYYGKQFENVIRSSGVEDFLKTISVPVWLTESGIQGPNNQLAYVETVWPFLKEKIPTLERIYYYQFGETTPVDVNFGLKTTDPSTPVSDLYVFLRDGTR